MNTPLNIEDLWNAMPRDVQSKVSCHDLKRTVDNYNGITNKPFDREVMKTWVNDAMKQVHVNVAARDLVKRIEGREGWHSDIDGHRLTDTHEWAAFYTAVSRLDSDNQLHKTERL